MKIKTLDTEILELLRTKAPKEVACFLGISCYRVYNTKRRQKQFTKKKT